MNYINENRLNFIIENTVDKFIMENAFDEITKKQVKHSTKSFADKIKDKLENKSVDDNSDKDNNSKDDDEKFGPKDIRKNADDRIRHCDNHSSVVQYADHNTGSQNSSNKGNDIRGMGFQALFLILDAGIIDSECKYIAQHKGKVVWQLCAEKQGEYGDC